MAEHSPDVRSAVTRFLAYALMLAVVGALAYWARTDPAFGSIRPLGQWHRSGASEYSWHDPDGGGRTQACAGYGAPRLRDAAHSFAARWPVRSGLCGKRVEFCFHRRCAVGVRWDSGPYAYTAYRKFDLNRGLARAVHFSGLGTVRWRYIR